MTARRQVAEGDWFYRLFLDSTGMLETRVAEGALAYARDVQLDLPVSMLPRGNWDEAGHAACRGMVSVVYTKKDAARMRRFRFPVINVSNAAGPWEGLGNFLSDDVAVGEMAGRYLKGRGYRHFLLFRQSEGRTSMERGEGFRKAVSGGVLRDVEYSFRGGPVPWNPLVFERMVEETLRPVLAELPMDLGIFATNDIGGSLMVRTLEHWFPDRFHTSAVLGVDNANDTYYAGPGRGLSSIEPGFLEMGREAMAWLAENEGARIPIGGLVRRFPPRRVFERDSTAGTRCADPLTARMVRWTWLRLRDGERITVADIAGAHKMSRRTLERKFETHLGTSVHDLIIQVRIELACQLLRDTRFSVAEISATCGFAKQESLSRAMRHATGQTPLEYRRTHRSAFSDY